MHYKQYDKDVLKHLQKVTKEIVNDFVKICNENDLEYFAAYGTALGAVRHRGFIPWDDDVDIGMFRRDYEKFLNIMESRPNVRYEILSAKTDSRYASTVTHFQKKNTRFISYNSRHLKCSVRIGIDVFPFDNLPDQETLRKKQRRETWILGRLLFLRGSAFPVIPWKGIKGMAAKAICFVVHYGLALFRVSPETIYIRLEKVSIQYNKSNTKDVTCFLDADSIFTQMKKKDMVPFAEAEFEDIKLKVPANNHEVLTALYGDYMKLPPVEKRENHCPYILDFGGDK